MALTDYSTKSLIDTITKNQGYLERVVEDKYDTHLDLNMFCTVDNTLQGVAGDIKTIDVYGATGEAIDVAEGEGNTESIATTLTPKRYQIKCAQAWYSYSDEALMRDPFAVDTGIKHLGVAMFNKVNADIFTEMGKATLEQSAALPDFNAFVDAVGKLKIDDAAGETALDAQQRFIPQVFAILSKNDVAKARKALKDELKYIEAFVRTGYVGTVAGVNLYYRQNQPDNNITVATRKAVTVFNKTGVNVEVAARSGGAEGTANKRMNDIFSRKYYIAALTDETQICKLTLTGA